MRAAYLIAIIGVALACVIGVDIRGASTAARSANDMLDNATRSIELVEDVRWQVHRLGHASVRSVPAILARLDGDIASYTPLATGPGEAEEWEKVHDALALAREAANAGDFARVEYVTRSLSDDVDRLVEINHREAELYVQRMHADRIYELVGDIIAVAVAALVLALLARTLFKAQTRSRRLIAESLARTEERNRELDAFAGRAAHDLRAPLHPIRGYAELIAIDPAVSDATRRQASLITKSVLRMTHVIDDMLALSRAGHPEPGTAAVVPTLASVREELAAELTGVAIEAAVDELAVACSESSLEQILRNLLGNASKYRSPDRPLAVLISATRDGALARIEVADNGIGMDAETRAHAFDPFYRARRDIAGTGLGLSIVERIARTSNGRCELLAGDPGTRVVLWLPLAAC